MLAEALEWEEQQWWLAFSHSTPSPACGLWGTENLQPSKESQQRGGDMGMVWENPSLGCLWGTCPQCCLRGCWQQQGFQHSCTMDTSMWASAACDAQLTLIHSSLMNYRYVCMISKSTNCSHPDLFVGGEQSTFHAVVPYVWLYITVSCSEINASHSIAHMVCSQR